MSNPRSSIEDTNGSNMFYVRSFLSSDDDSDYSFSSFSYNYKVGIPSPSPLPIPNTNPNSDLPVIRLKVGDILQVIELSPDGKWCKAIISHNNNAKTNQEKKAIYGLNTFGSNATRLRSSAEDLLPEVKEIDTKLKVSEPTPPTSPTVSPPSSPPPTKKPQPTVSNVPPAQSMTVPLKHGNDFESKQRNSLARADTSPNLQGNPQHVTTSPYGRMGYVSARGSTTISKSASPPPSQPREVLKIYLKDGSFRTLSLLPSTTSDQIIRMIINKMPNMKALINSWQLSEVSLDGKEEKVLKADESPLDIIKKWKSKDSKKFVLSMKEKTVQRMSLRMNEIAKLSAAASANNKNLSASEKPAPSSTSSTSSASSATPNTTTPTNANTTTSTSVPTSSTTATSAPTVPTAVTPPATTPTTSPTVSPPSSPMVHDKKIDFDASFTTQEDDGLDALLNSLTKKQQLQMNSSPPVSPPLTPSSSSDSSQSSQKEESRRSSEEKEKETKTESDSSVSVVEKKTEPVVENLKFPFDGNISSDQLESLLAELVHQSLDSSDESKH